MIESKGYGSTHLIFKNYFTDKGQITEQSIKSIKKQILLEIQISEQSYLDLEGEKISKQDVLNFFDENTLESFEGIQYIESNPELKAYLIEGKVPKLEHHLDLMQIILSDLRRNFLLPYLKFASNRVFKTEIRKSNFINCRVNASISYFDSILDTEEVYKPVTSLIKNLIFILDSRIFNEKSKEDLKTKDLYLFLNELPDHNFEEIRNKLAESLVNFSFYTSMSNDQRRLGNLMLKAARSLDCEIKLAHHIENNFNATKSRAIRIGSYQTNLRYLTILTIWIIFMFFRISRCNQNSSYQRPSPTYKYDDREIQRINQEIESIRSNQHN